MGPVLLSILVGGLGLAMGLILGYYVFGRKPTYVVDQEAWANELEWQSTSSGVEERELNLVDGLNRFIIGMWPVIHHRKSEIDAIISSIAQSLLPDDVQFENIILGLPPKISSIRISETPLKRIAIDLDITWIGAPEINLVGRSVPLRVVDFDIRIGLYITCIPLVGGCPMFTDIRVSLVKKPHVDFKLKCLDRARFKKFLSSLTLPVVCRVVLRKIRAASKDYIFPKYYDISIMDAPKYMYGVAANKPVGKLDVTVVWADKIKIKNAFVKLSLSGDDIPPKMTTTKYGTLNPVWNEKFELLVKDPEAQFLEIELFCENKNGSFAMIGQPTDVMFVKDLLKSMERGTVLILKPHGLLKLVLVYQPQLEDLSEVGVG